ncbi:hypothetical protein Ancab_035409 [Ancistrocladus abbreviatus]
MDSAGLRFSKQSLEIGIPARYKTFNALTPISSSDNDNGHGLADSLSLLVMDLYVEPCWPIGLKGSPSLRQAIFQAEFVESSLIKPKGGWGFGARKQRANDVGWGGGVGFAPRWAAAPREGRVEDFCDRTADGMGVES